MSVLGNEVVHYIDGKLTKGASTQTQPIYNPATGQVIRQLFLAESVAITAFL